MDNAKTTQFVEKTWNDSIFPALSDFVRIPNLSPMFDVNWSTNGLQEQAARLMVDWALAQGVANLTAEVVQVEGRTPTVFIEIAGSDPNCPTVLMYGHLDKQPHFEGWREGLGPCLPVVQGDKFYGRGVGDDGYAVFAAVASVKACQEQGVPHGRCVILIEGCEESGSPDLMFYLDLLQERIGVPHLVLVLDCGAGNYDQLWLTTSLRGLVQATLKVAVATDGVHSGDASGVIPSTFRIARELLDRIENAKTGQLHEGLYVTIPEERLKQAEVVCKSLGPQMHKRFPFVAGTQPVHQDDVELFLNRTWRPQLTVTGANGLPPIATAGNVLLPELSLRLSLRLPPTLDADSAVNSLKDLLTSDPPYNAQVTFEQVVSASGWNAKPLESWLHESVQKSSQAFYSQPCALWGVGGSIPFLHMLGLKYPQSQFVVTGSMGPESYAHGPNENLDIPMTKKLICCMANLLADHYRAVSAAL
eukprot:GILK01005474.1.p1 GENE.GILK01005474.1~~GILK01005474.1.p1  ORF type:complete len:475 (-),score=78.59 GILK01005474.1:43-1467(-)